MLFLGLFFLKSELLSQGYDPMPPGGGEGTPVLKPIAPTCPPCGEGDAPSDFGENFYFCAIEFEKQECIEKFGNFADEDEESCKDYLPLGDWDVGEPVVGEQSYEKYDCCMMMVTGCGTVGRGVDCSESDGKVNRIYVDEVMTLDIGGTSSANRCACDIGYECEGYDDARVVCEDDRGSQLDIWRPTFGEIGTTKVTCYEDTESCKLACGPTPTPFSQTIMKCNPNFFDPENPTFDAYRTVPICIGSTTPDELPECVVKDECWKNTEPCMWRCQGYYYCDPIVQGCRFGFFLRPGKEDCEAKLAEHGLPGNCYDTEPLCQVACAGCLPQCDTPENTCVGTSVSDGCGGTCTGTKVCTPTFDPGNFSLMNQGLVIVPSDDQGRNHICQDEFWNELAVSSRVVEFNYSIGSTEGGEAIEAIMLAFSDIDGNVALASTIYNMSDGKTPLNYSYGTGSSEADVLISVQPVVENGPRNVNFEINFHEDFPNSLNYLWVAATDENGTTLPWTYAGRAFKSWDCKVRVSGTLYDGSGETNPDCVTGVGFSLPADEKLNFNSLSYSRMIDLGTTETKNMDVFTVADFRTKEDRIDDNCVFAYSLFSFQGKRNALLLLNNYNTLLN